MRGGGALDRAAADEARHEAEEAQAEAQRLARDRSSFRQNFPTEAVIYNVLNASKRSAASRTALLLQQGLPSIAAVAEAAAAAAAVVVFLAVI